MEAGAVVASALVKSLCGKLNSAVLDEFSLLWGVEKDQEALKETISTVKAVLEDAGKCYITDAQTYKYLKNLKEKVYDVDDLLERLYLEAQIRNRKPRGRKSRVIVNFLTKLNLVKRYKLAHKIKSITRKLDAIAANNEKFHLDIKETMRRDNISIKNQMTCSIIDEGEIYGRERERDEIMKQLVQNNNHEKISTIAIVGLGGLGKTTLAQLVYKSARHELKEYFDLTMWIHVSQSFDLKIIVKSMVEQVTQKSCDYENWESVVEQLISGLKGKKNLLILDDVWSDKYEDWENLKSVLQNGASGNKIIVTTRSMRVVSMMEAAFDISTFKINLEVLSDDCSTNLFNKRAFGEYESRVDSGVRGIAEEIIKKCGGVPLALNILGSIMRSKDSIEEWKAVRDSAIWALGEDGDQVMNSLKLSYMNLSPCLKECFSYCSIFPKGIPIYKLELIDQWMAHRLVSLEDEGNKYFKQLVQMFFFQNVDEQESGEVTCKMHDLVHDLARSINREFILINNERDVSSNISGCYRYLSSKCLSIIAASNIIEKVRGLYIGVVDDDDIVPKVKCLRSIVLDKVMCRWNFFSQKLIHLRHICVTTIWIQDIPIDFGALRSLESFHLKICHGLKKLPESIGNAAGLRTLKLECEDLESLPESIGQCRNLQNLIVQAKKLECIPNSTSQLVNIRLFHLVKCHVLKRLPDKVFEKCTSIRSINFYNCWKLEEIPASIGSLVNLESLNLSGCTSLESLPESIGNAAGLRTLKLECEDLESLPESIGQCRNLQNLIVQSKKLECIPNSISQLVNIRLFHLVEYRELKRLPNKVFEKCTSITSINFYNCHNLEEIPLSIGNLVNLESLNLSGCNSLKSLPNSIGDLQNLHSLDLSSSGIMVLPSSIHKLVNLDTLNVNYCDKLRELPGSLGEIKKLRFLDMERTNMDGMPIGIGKLTDLRRLHKFAVAEESKYARISELEHLNLLGGSLEISGLDKVSDPREVVSANLKQKKYLDDLSLMWGKNIDAQERDWDVALLEALQPPSGINALQLEGYPGSEYSTWMMLEETNMSSFPYLTSVSLFHVFKCTHLPRLVELSSIRHLSLRFMDSLRKFTGYYCQGLVRLVLSCLNNLEELTTIRLVSCEEHGINYSYESAFPNLSTLEIYNCPKLRIKPHLPPSLKKLELEGRSEKLLAGAVLCGEEASSHISLSSLGLMSLRMRQVKLPTECQLLGQLSSLAKLYFYGCQFDNCLPNSMRHLCSLLELTVTDCKGLDSLPEWFGELKSLQHLAIFEAPLTSLPQSMQQLTELKFLKITGCPELGKRCERESGEDWHLISHIGYVVIR